LTTTSCVPPKTLNCVWTARPCTYKRIALYARNESFAPCRQRVIHHHNRNANGAQSRTISTRSSRLLFILLNRAQELRNRLFVITTRRPLTRHSVPRAFRLDSRITGRKRERKLGRFRMRTYVSAPARILWAPGGRDADESCDCCIHRVLQIGFRTPLVPNIPPELCGKNLRLKTFFYQTSRRNGKIKSANLISVKLSREIQTHPKRHIDVILYDVYTYIYIYIYFILQIRNEILQSSVRASSVFIPVPSEFQITV
jgi:hypothetical protein